ncbi:MAG TPA: hypothetical protein VHD56_09090 [Tepidisphaeraceae bacterium]|nr:hypothetical protein [Tepidisphaeraceae bacterium]
MRWTLLLIVAATMVFLPQVNWGQDDSTETSSPRPVLGMLDAIHKASTPSEAVDAYARAIAVSTDSIFAEQAFISRMVELNSPELAQTQAQDVTLHVEDGLAWGVLAYSSARAGQFDAAMEQMSQAARISSGNDFVQRTAAQLLAWYDTKVDQATLSDATKKRAELLRTSMSRGKLFNQEYASSHDILLATTGAQNQPPVSDVIIAGGSISDFGTYSGYGSGGVNSGPELVRFWGSSYLYPGYYYNPPVFSYLATPRFYGSFPTRGFVRSGFNGFRGRPFGPTVGTPPARWYGNNGRLLNNGQAFPFRSPNSPGRPGLGRMR